MRSARPGGRPPTSSTCSRTRWWRSTGTASTPIPYLAKSWTVSPDGKTYTFKLRDDVTFCSGKKFTAEDVVYTFKRLKDPETKGPFAWRAGNIKELRAPDPYTVEYELGSRSPSCCCSSPCSPTSSTTRTASRRWARTTASRAPTAPGRGASSRWQPRTEIVLKRHDAYKWGPSMYKNKGPVKFEKLVIKIVPEDSSRVAAMMAGQFDITHQFPSQFIAQAKAAPMLTVHRGQAQLPAALFRLQDDAADGGRQARARGHEHRHRPRRDRQGHPARQRRSGLHHRRSGRARLTIPKTGGIVKEDVERAKKLLDEAGWKPGADGMREKDGVKLAPRVYYTANANSAARRRGDPGLPAQDRRRLAASTRGTPPSRRSRWPSRTTRSGR